ncbi:hypothetical protein [Pseudomonas sp. BF-R-24]|uniref:hypothetical protein n=1 Tax=Pseudomonas sp. BF-R-24 TaxID=2832386 RepID=UPI001CC0EA6F|nr:hypothetical protein [Pseudomonas sp. BF-R-24]
MANTLTTNDSGFTLLTQELRDFGLPDSYYSLGHERDERTCMILYKEKWLVYFSERGSMEGKNEFDSFEGARAYLIKTLRQTL